MFNSFTQWKAYGSLARAAGKSCGLRLNPECSTQPSDHAMYDPCGPDSRLGITIENFQPELLDGIEASISTRSASRIRTIWCGLSLHSSRISVSIWMA